VTPNGFVHYVGGGKPGLRLAVKDNIDVAGMPCAAGMETLRGRIALRDAPCVARLKADGYTVVGKTLMDEAAFGALGDNPWFGRCDNPRRRGYTCGGSSAGSAAAVAEGLCDVALGTDTLGSVRIPASYCGVVGYAPSPGLISTAGVMPLMPQYDRVGVLATTVARAAAVASVSPRSGARAGELPQALDLPALRRAALLTVEIEGARIHAALLEEPASKISPALRAALRFGRDAGAERIEKAKARIEAARRALREAFRNCDVLILPTTPGPAFPFDQPAPESQADYTVLANVAGLAAISVPGRTVEGLPVGTQVIGPDDGLVLGAALELERVAR
jgi:aspartyl-tRNA(Asn)/glutamyl-tRNA(Gln) amidotransferase subunit A